MKYSQADTEKPTLPTPYLAYLPDGTILHMAWIYLVLAGFLEVGFVFSLKFSHGFTKLWPSVIFLACELTSFYFLSQVLKTMPAGTAYAVWTGIGAIGTVLVGMVFLGESKDLLRLGAILLIVAGVAGLRLLGGE